MARVAVHVQAQKSCCKREGRDAQVYYTAINNFVQLTAAGSKAARYMIMVSFTMLAVPRDLHSFSSTRETVPTATNNYMRVHDGLCW